jgi:hypothetical protein
MTEHEAAKIQAALERARANKLSIMGHGTMKSDGAHFLAVNSASEPNTWHVVIIRQGRLECDCKAGQRGQICQHRALVHEQLQAKRDEHLANECWSLTEKGAMAVAEHRAQAAKREQSMRRECAAFSLLK